MRPRQERGPSVRTLLIDAHEFASLPSDRNPDRRELRLLIEELLDRCAIYHLKHREWRNNWKRMRPGVIIEDCNPRERELLRQLQSDDLQDIPVPPYILDTSYFYEIRIPCVGKVPGTNAYHGSFVFPGPTRGPRVFGPFRR